ncbi:CoA pyrophosphatase [Xanthobacter autotrophicus]|uniref:CoA pyrophosphatase n=1 Tax=Xanthobacter autotrophicus TaxID=280 RepID=UPI0024A63B35|nr:CoA pyrophosphatase [Xanthobacter autotrophicus]MDI4658050.1 CoA pyrophosphatase [Xanthobacter autotrophicus]
MTRHTHVDVPSMTGTADALSDFLARAAARLSPAPPPFYSQAEFLGLNGDHALQPEKASLAPAATPRHAAVLVPVVARPEPTILLTLRSSNLSNHAGQVAFPGGRVDPGDRDELDAALREAREEVGLESHLVRPLGYLDGYLSGTGFWITPVVGLVDPSYVLTLNPAEVDEAFEVPLGFLMSPRNHERQSREWKGTLRHFYVMPYEGRNIWGATAGMLRNLYEKVYA